MDQGPAHSTRSARSSPFAWLSGTLGPLLALVVIVALFAGLGKWKHGERSAFFTLRNLHAISVQASPVAVAALGMTVIIIAGGIDLSSGTALALSATVLAVSLREGYGPALAIAAAIGTGCLTGLINGALIAGLRVVPFIITLGTMMAYLGVAKIFAAETTVRPALNQIPSWLTNAGLVTTQPKPLWLIPSLLPNFASGVWLAFGLAAGLALVLRFTVFGLHVFALGSNESTARLCGINVPLTKIAVYVLSGLFVGIAGLYQFARLSSGNPTSGIGLELRIIAAVVIGGGSLNGGRGSVLGTLAGAAMTETIRSGCTQMGWSNPIQDIIIGVIIVAAVTLDQLRQRATRA